MARTDDKHVPILGSVETLANAHAIIDFRTGACMLKDVLGDQVIFLEKASSGHWMLDLTEDLATNSSGSETAADAIREFVVLSGSSSCDH